MPLSSPLKPLTLLTASPRGPFRSARLERAFSRLEGGGSLRLNYERLSVIANSLSIQMFAAMPILIRTLANGSFVKFRVIGFGLGGRSCFWSARKKRLTKIVTLRCLPRTDRPRSFHSSRSTHADQSDTAGIEPAHMPHGISVTITASCCPSPVPARAFGFGFCRTSGIS